MHSRVDYQQPHNEALCRDRFWSMPKKEFSISSCSKCYVYLIRESPQFVQGRHVGPLSTVYGLVYNGSQLGRGYMYLPTSHNQSVLDIVCSTMTQVDCRRWIDCCYAATECCDKQRITPVPPTSGPMCEQTWDGWSCWAYTQAGQNVSGICPTFIPYSQPEGKTMTCGLSK